MDRFDPFVKYADVYGDVINWEKDPMNYPKNQNKYFFSDGKTYYEQICKMLRLMSVFKEAFNQIYDNEDEISGAWESFVENLSATAVSGSEPGVTLTWTDDSVNFEFTLVPGRDGADGTDGRDGTDGVGISSISFNSDYTMTITLTNGSVYTSESLRGPIGETGARGPQGEKGEPGEGLNILDVYTTLQDLQTAHPTGSPGEAYQVGTAPDFTLYIWSVSRSEWMPAGTLGSVSPSLSNPLMDGVASAGSSDLYSRGDHVHPTDTSRASQEELDALIKTSQSLIDQSFTYRESPAIQDGLARLDKIKGNTLVFNQLVQNGNFEDDTGWTVSGFSASYSNNEASLQVTSPSNGSFLNGNVLGTVVGHKYYAKADVFFPKVPETNIFLGSGGYEGIAFPYSQVTANAWTTVNGIYTRTTSDGSDNLRLYPRTGNFAVDDVIKVKNIIHIDLTKMFGAGNEPTSVDEFISLFPLDYYNYNAGSLLSFNGTGLKSTGKNLFNLNRTVGTLPTGNVRNFEFDKFYVGMTSNNYYASFTITNYEVTNDSVKVQCSNAGYGIGFPFRVKPNTTYTVSFNGSNGNTNPVGVGYYDNDGNYLSNDNVTNSPMTFTTPSGCYIADIVFRPSLNILMTYSNVQLENGSQATSYESYTENTIDLPISTYFPTGMKSAGSVYDELTSSKAITRVGAVDLGDLTWVYDSNVPRFYTVGIASLINKPVSNSVIANVVSPLYKITSGDDILNNKPNMSLAVTYNGNVSIINTSYSDATAFKTAMSGVYLYYELATPTETSVDLDLDFMADEKGTEQLLPVNGSVPSTSPVIADMTYLSIDDAMEYVLEKLANVPQNTQQILESLEDDVADLQTDVGALQTSVSGLQTSVGNINTNIGQLSSTVAGHTSSISDMQSDITDLNTGMSNYMPVDRKASASQLGGIKVGNNLSIDADGVLSASGNSELTLSGTVNITSSTSPAQTPVYRNVDLKYRASSDHSILIFYGTCECKGSGGTTVTTVTTDLIIPNWTKGETRIGGVPFNSSADVTSLVIRSNGRVDFELTGSTNFATYFFPPYRMVLADY